MMIYDVICFIKDEVRMGLTSGISTLCGIFFEYEPFTNVNGIFDIDRFLKDASYIVAIIAGLLGIYSFFHRKYVKYKTEKQYREEKRRHAEEIDEMDKCK